eukprot:g17321.t1
MLIFDNEEKIKFRQTFQLSNKINALVLTAEGRAIVDINMKSWATQVGNEMNIKTQAVCETSGLCHFATRVQFALSGSAVWIKVYYQGQHGPRIEVTSEPKNKQIRMAVAAFILKLIALEKTMDDLKSQLTKGVAEFHKEDSPKKTNWRRIPNKNKLPYVDQDVAILLPQYKENDALNSPESLSSVDILNAPTGKERKHVPPPGQDTDNSLNMSNQTLEEDDYVSFKPILNLAAHAAKSVEKYPTLSLVPLLAVLLSQLVRVLLHQK